MSLISVTIMSRIHQDEESPGSEKAGMSKAETNDQPPRRTATAKWRASGLEERNRRR